MSKDKNKQTSHSPKRDFIMVGRGRGRKDIKGKNTNQNAMIASMTNPNNILTIGEGPAGTGKTYIAVAAAVEALEEGEFNKIVICRPAVESGKKLGFLPGDLGEKLDPFMRPIFDALHEFLGKTKVDELMKEGAVEVASISHMRGRTFKNTFVMMDEAQNAEAEEILMFITRIGEGTRAVITGDPRQGDLGHNSGFEYLHRLLKAGGKNLSSVTNVVHFKPADVVRHPFVQAIIEADEKLNKK
jgi:phosphate starvation-inducible PhoH-like protein